MSEERWGEAQCVTGEQGSGHRSGGRLLVAVLFTDPSFSGSVRGAVVVSGVVVVGGCRSALLFLLCFHPLGVGLVLQFPVLPLGREGRRG